MAGQKLTQKQAAAFREWVGTRGTTDKCPFCQKNSWMMGEYLVTPLVTSSGNVQLGGIVHPLIPIVCTNCGHTLFFNAIVAGVMKADPGNENG
ncbi:hypothetical protein IIA16_01460 [bacterium]|nr:hypothetical protein [bacterium]